MIRLSASEVRDKFSEVLSAVSLGHQRLMLQWHDKDLVAMIPVEDLLLLEKLEDRADLLVAKRRWQRRGCESLGVRRRLSWGWSRTDDCRWSLAFILKVASPFNPMRLFRTVREDAPFGSTQKLDDFIRKGEMAS